MTALREYQRLECPGLWREMPEAQRRDVIVTFGDATIVLRESPSERALTHWSLPAVVRLNPGRMPALFAPGPGAAEESRVNVPIKTPSFTSAKCSTENPCAVRHARDESTAARYSA